MMMKRLTVLALGAALGLGGCEGSPLQAFVQETFGVGHHLQTDAFVTEIAPGLPYPSPTVVFSPDGSRYVYSHNREDGRIYLGATGHPASPLDAHAQRPPSWSPDGKRLAVMRSSGTDIRTPRWTLSAVDLESKTTMPLAEAALGHTPWLAWSPDGSSLLYASDENGDVNAESLNLVTVANPAPRRIAEIAPFVSGSAPALWSPDGQQIAYLTKVHGFLNAFNLMTRRVSDEETKVLRRVPGSTSLVWSTDGSAIGYLSSGSASGEFEVHRVLLSDGSEEVTPFALGGATEMTHASGMKGFIGFQASDLSPDHRWCIVTHGEDPLYARELSTGRHVRLTDRNAWVRGWTADSKAIVASTSKGGVDRYYRIQIER